MPTLNEQQKYLLNRLPRPYDLKQVEIADTPAVKAARKVIEAHDKCVEKQKCERQQKFKAALESAREAIYFKKPEEALAKVAALESAFPNSRTC